jgi:hypothetical protein
MSQALAIVVPAIPYLLSLLAVLATFYGIRHTNKVNAELQDRRLTAEQQRLNRDLLRSKGEELFILLDRHEQELRKVIVETHARIANSLGYKREGNHSPLSPDLQGDYNATNSMLQSIEMLAMIYFPLGLGSLQRLLSYRQTVSNTFSQLLQSNERVRTHLLNDQLLEIAEDVQNNSIELRSTVMFSLQSLHADIGTPTP